MSLKLACINIERSKHLELVEKFFAESDADVICIQELMGEDVPRLYGAFRGAASIFEPMGLRPDEAPVVTMGMGIFSRLPLLSSGADYYVGESGNLPLATQADTSSYNNFNRMILSVEVEKSGVHYKVATTHFTWTPDGRPTDRQRKEFESLKMSLSGLGEFTLCGDFNAPRGGEVFDALAHIYKDNIPPEYTTSIDGSLHRAGHLERMVDGLFTTPAYRASGVKLVSGVSDHMAVVGDIDRIQ